MARTASPPLGRLVLVLACLVALVAPVGAAAAEPGEGERGDRETSGQHEPGLSRQQRDELAASARADGTVSAMVGLRAGFQPEGELRSDEVRAQRSEIARVRGAVLRELRGTGAEVVHTYDTVPALALELTEEAVHALADSEHVTRATLDQPLSAQLDTSAELVQADQMQELGVTGEGSVIAVLDSGIDTDHDFLGDRVVAEACFSSTQGPRTSLCPNGQNSQIGPGSGVNCWGDPVCEHGTHVAGIAAGSGHTVHGVARAAQLMSVQVFHRTTRDCTEGTSSCLRVGLGDLAKALEHVHQRHEDLDLAAVTLSLGTAIPNSEPCDQHDLAPYIDNLRSVGIATVAASGNLGWTDALSAPACIPSAIAVGATTDSDVVWRHSNSHPTMLDLLAPGVNITSSIPGGGFRTDTGTSMAVPHVAGAWAALREYAPGADVDEVLEALQLAGKPIVDTRADADATFPRLLIHDAATGPLEIYGLCPRPFEDVGSTHPFCLEISWLVAEEITTGFADGTFRPTNPVTRQAAAAFLHRMADTPSTGVSSLSQFSDVDPDHQFAQEIAWLVDAGITTGYPDGTFRPAADVSRQAIAAFLHRLEGSPGADTAVLSQFSDVDPGHQFAQEIAWLVDAGITGGFSDGTFRPAVVVSRQASAAFLHRYAQP